MANHWEFSPRIMALQSMVSPLISLTIWMYRDSQTIHQFGISILDLYSSWIEASDHRLGSSPIRFHQFLHVCRERDFRDSRNLLLSLWKSLFPTLLRPKTVCSCVGLFPLSNGVTYSVIKICLHQCQQIIRNVFQNRIWDPGIYGCESDGSQGLHLHIRSKDLTVISRRRHKIFRSMEFQFKRITTENDLLSPLYDSVCHGSYGNKVKEDDLFFRNDSSISSYFDGFSVPWMYQCVSDLGFVRLRRMRSTLSSHRRLFSETSPTTSSSHLFIKVMLKAFWSLSSKLLANKIMKGGHSRFHLLAYKPTVRIAWLLSTLSLKLFRFLIFANNVCFGMHLYFVNIT